LTAIYSRRSDKMKENDMDGACDEYWGRARPVQDVGGETLGKETTGETQA